MPPVSTWRRQIGSLLFGGKIPNARPSMLLDYNAGRRGEVDAINGSIPRLGEQYGVPTPINKTIVGIIKAREAGFPA